ncbi:unnamed protein product [Cuscuta europaea]|uniref:Uncharacterized protein n=1 Tax=Cuscuta europaea TaxID=41803 RepID=A0A9P0ZZG9_CUSEU|nr:unnamed protein product [Cuscuta europaea]
MGKTVNHGPTYHLLCVILQPGPHKSFLLGISTYAVAPHVWFLRMDTDFQRSISHFPFLPRFRGGADDGDGDGGFRDPNLDLGKIQTWTSRLRSFILSQNHFLFFLFTENQSISHDFFVEHQDHMNLLELVPTDGISVEFIRCSPEVQHLFREGFMAMGL